MFGNLPTVRFIAALRLLVEQAADETHDYVSENIYAFASQITVNFSLATGPHVGGEDNQIDKQNKSPSEQEQ